MTLFLICLPKRDLQNLHLMLKSNKLNELYIYQYQPLPVLKNLFNPTLDSATNNFLTWYLKTQ